MPCGPTNKTVPVVACCTQGSICYSDNFCGTTSPGTGLSNWYIAGCTNPILGTGCSTSCQALANDGAVFNSTSNMWQCCGSDQNGNENCLSPSLQEFSAPAPSDLVPYYTVPSTGDSTLSSTKSDATVTLSRADGSGPTPRQTSTSTTSATLLNSTVPSSTGKLSTPAAVGIGVVTTVAVTLAVFAGVAATYFYRKRRRQQPIGKHPEDPAYTDDLQQARLTPTPVELDFENYVSEMPPGRNFPQEMMAERSPQELPASDYRDPT